MEVLLPRDFRILRPINEGKGVGVGSWRGDGGTTRRHRRDGCRCRRRFVRYDQGPRHDKEELQELGRLWRGDLKGVNKQNSHSKQRIIQELTMYLYFIYGIW